MLGRRRAVYTAPRAVLTLLRESGLQKRSIKNHPMLKDVKIAVRVQINKRCVGLKPIFLF